MIAYLEGKLSHREGDRVTVLVGGVGYEVLVPQTVLDELSAGQGHRQEDEGKIALHIHTHVREDAISLFGFLNRNDRQLFQNVLGVNGVGPKLALNIFSQMSTDDLISAVQGEEVARIQALKGVGEKTAKLIVLGLKKKVGDWEKAPLPASSKVRHVKRDAEEALVQLGYSRNQAQQALHHSQISKQTTVQDLIKESLQHLSGV